MSPPRKIAVAAGVLYLVTHVTSTGELALYGPVLNSPDYIVGAGADTAGPARTPARLRAGATRPQLMHGPLGITRRDR